MKKKLVLAIAAVACLAAIMACGSMAYFNASKTVTNKFMVSSYDPNNPPSTPITQDDLFSIVVEETEVIDGVKTPNKTTTGNEYKNIVPGAQFSKDPTVKCTGEYGAYVRMNVTFTNAKNWATSLTGQALSTTTDLTSVLKNLNTTNWTMDATTTTIDTTGDGEITYVFYYNTALTKGQSTAPLFDAVEIPASFTSSDMIGLAYFEVKITADAIQSANTGSTAKGAFDSFWN